MPSPKVTFVVPCYKLAHLLAECVSSILQQTYDNLEVLIMDDCSPDNTPEVARSFGDPRVKHIRNDPNLKHLRNYNKGIGLATGDYIWLISADDRLRQPYVVQRYVEAMENNPRVGFAFCPGMGLRDGRETELVEWARLDYPDGILPGRTFLHRLLESNCVLAPAGMVRRECYEKLGAFPLDLPFAGDWYLWCLFALHYDAAYFSEPMVNYREHAESMTDSLSSENVRLLSKDDLAVRWRMKALIEQQGDPALAKHCLDTLVEYYTQAMVAKRWRSTRYRMSLEEFELSLNTHATDPALHADIRRRVFAGIGARLHLDRDLAQDPRVYRLALQHNPTDLKLRLKYLVLLAGAPGAFALEVAATVRSATRRLWSKGSQA